MFLPDSEGESPETPPGRMKCVFVVVDGLGDLPVPALGGLTPLEAAQTPTLDRLASQGYYGRVDPIARGITPHTDSGTGILFGMHPEDAGRLRRGAVEAAGTGRRLREGEIALRVNFASIEASNPGYLVTDRRAGRIIRGVPELSAAIAQLDLGDGVLAEFQPTEQHRGVLVLSGSGLDPAISDTDPGDTDLPAPLLKCRALDAGAQRTAEKVNVFVRLAHDLLKNHSVNVRRHGEGKAPANGVITRGAGSSLRLGNAILESGLSVALISGCNTVRGLGKLFGFEVINDPRFTAGLDTDVRGKIEAALEALQTNDLAYVHIKAPDICAHDRQPEAKRDFIERLDAALEPLFQKQVVMALAADHTTDSNTGIHTPDPVPALLYVPVAGRDAVSIKFGERTCSTGTMPRQTSAQFLQRVLDATFVTTA